MKKTTIYLPDEVKEQVEKAAKEENRSEADVIRDAVAKAMSDRRPRKPRVLSGTLSDPTVGRRVDELLDGFGE